jgi:hypothetical protein
MRLKKSNFLIRLPYSKGAEARKPAFRRGKLQNGPIPTPMTAGPKAPPYNMKKPAGLFLNEEPRRSEAGMLYYSFRRTNFPLIFEELLKKAGFHRRLTALSNWQYLRISAKCAFQRSIR